MGARTLELVRELEPFLFSSPPLRMNRAFMEYMRKHEKDYEPGK